MPLRNGTGPNGDGALTGRGLGNCNNNAQIGFRGQSFGMGRGNGRGMAYGRGNGRGFGMGYGRGFGRGYGANAGYSNNTPELSAQQEATVLKEEITAMQNDIDLAKKRINELEGEKESK